MADSAIQALVGRLEKVTIRLEAVEKQLGEGGAKGGSVASGPSAASVQEYEDLVNQFIKPFVEQSNKIGDEDVKAQAELVLKAVNAQRDFLQIAANSKKPSDAVFQTLLKPTSDLMGQIVAIKDTKRASKFANNLSTISEGIGALSWVCVSPTPGPHVGDMRGGSEFYSNRLLKDFKGKDQNQVDWVTSFNTFLKELQAFIKKNHTTGLTWNPHGGEASSAPSSSSAPAQSAPKPVATKPTGGAEPVNILAALSKGTEIQTGLKKVTSDMKTKNRDPSEKSSVVPATSVKAKTETAHSGKPEVQKPPKFALEGNKWAIEYQVGNKNIVIENAESKQTVYIYKCKDSTIQIKGKVNSIAVDDCTKTGVVFENAIASFEVVNSRALEVQILGSVPSFAIDKTSGCQIYLSKDCLGIEIISSKSSEMNVSLPPQNPEDDSVEIAIPEQYRTVVKNNKLVTEVVAHV